jgi:hypothetical protein
LGEYAPGLERLPNGQIEFTAGPSLQERAPR